MSRWGFWRYRLAERAAAWISPDVRLSEYGRRWVGDVDFLREMERFEGRGNTRALDRKWTLRELLKWAKDVEGDTAECGVWRGGSTWLIARGLGRTHYAFDSFEGLSEPGPSDGAFFRRGELAASEDEARARLAGLENVRLMKGWIPSRFAEVAERRFAFVHVDVDLARPTRDALEFFWPRLSPGGVLVLDDYGFAICPGVKREADAFLKEPILELATGQGVVVKR